ncbi:MAG: hypothetical protein OXG35_29395 [Acidobacteria bacterium]|nr:hypothetical protein [Acidobacteriota bacterium]
MNREREQGWTRLSEVDVELEPLRALREARQLSASDLQKRADYAYARAVAWLEMAGWLLDASVVRRMQTPAADVEPAPAPPLRLVRFDPSITGRGRAARRDTGLRAVDPGDDDRSRGGGSAR